MNRQKRQDTKLFFKFLLLAVYFGFFAVQLLLRYTSPHAQQSLDFDSYQRLAATSLFAGKPVLSKEDSRKSKSVSYLNKRFHPKDNVVLPDLDLRSERFYVILSSGLYSPEERLKYLNTSTLSLRGPPDFC